MTRVTLLQSSFSAGVLDPRLNSRTDIKQYFQGLSLGDNIKCLPQGGVKRRDGMKYIDDIGESARLVSFSFNTIQTYLIVFTDSLISIYKDDIKQAEIITTFTFAQIKELNYTQSADTLIIVHESHNPHLLVRQGSDTSWTLSHANVTNIPQYNFQDSLSPGIVQEVQDITFNGSWINGNNYTLTVEGQKTTDLIYTTSQAVTMQNALNALNNVSGVVVADQGSQVYRVTFPSDGRNWNLIIATIGFAVTGKFDVTGITDGSSALEDSMSDTRGWPRTVTFFESRLILGGTTYKPQSIWASKTNDFFNLDLGTSLSDEGIFITLDTDQVNAINGLYAGRHLQVLTTGGEFYSPTTPITPSDFVIKRQTQYGSSGLRPVSIDGATLFIDRYGTSLRELLYTYIEEAYNADSISVMAPHLLISPVDIAAQRGTELDESNYIYIVNSDGTLAVLNSLRSQEVTAWTRWTTNGLIENIAVVQSDVYLMVRRTINNGARWFLERVDVDTFTDSNVKQIQASSATVTGLDHLNGELCRVKADGAVMTDNTPSAGAITLVRPAIDVEVGLDFNPLFRTMPITSNFQDGSTFTRDKRISQVHVDVFETLGLYIDGRLVPTRQFGSGLLDQTPEPFSGLRNLYFNGWTEKAWVTLTQKDPLPMTVLGISIKVDM